MELTFQIIQQKLFTIRLNLIKTLVMNKLSKTIVTIVIIVVFFIFFSLIVGSRQIEGHQTPGYLGLIVFAGMVGAMRAIWKKRAPNKDIIKK